ncbi:JAB domain-containing protein, partial [Escherichia coli]|uniref:JAB domain-containing protein n=1 Tax=Escherichia coli TaxID=562 RepID=UPI002552D6AF
KVTRTDLHRCYSPISFTVIRTINRTEVHPREVIKRALYHNAAAVVLAHNHPSGEVTPSKADRLITERLVQALALVDIRVPDHLIVGGNQVFSFAEHGLL